MKASPRYILWISLILIPHYNWGFTIYQGRLFCLLTLKEWRDIIVKFLHLKSCIKCGRLIIPESQSPLRHAGSVFYPSNNNKNVCACRSSQNNLRDTVKKST